MWPLGGDVMAQLDLSVFAQKYKIVALIDKDPKSGHIRDKFAENCAAARVESFRLQRYSIENYFSVRALKEVFKGQIQDTLTAIDPDIKLEKQIGLNIKNNNKKIAQAMTLKEIEGTDLHDFLLKVQEICNRH
jgi:ACT domain-containing protein